GRHRDGERLQLRSTGARQGPGLCQRRRAVGANEPGRLHVMLADARLIQPWPMYRIPFQLAAEADVEMQVVVHLVFLAADGADLLAAVDRVMLAYEERPQVAVAAMHHLAIRQHVTD